MQRLLKRDRKELTGGAETPEIVTSEFEDVESTAPSTSSVVTEPGRPANFWPVDLCRCLLTCTVVVEDVAGAVMA